MSFRPSTEKKGGIENRTVSAFRGVHTRYTRVDQPEQYAAVCDFDCSQEKLKARAGRAKVGTGNAAHVTSLFGVTLSSDTLLGSVVNGVLSLRPLSDFLAVMVLSIVAICSESTGATLYVFPSDAPLSYQKLNTNFFLLNADAISGTNVAVWASNQVVIIESWTGSVNVVLAGLSNGLNVVSNRVGSIWSLEWIGGTWGLQPLQNPTALTAGYSRVTASGIQTMTNLTGLTDLWFTTNAVGSLITRATP